MIKKCTVIFFALSSCTVSYNNNKYPADEKINTDPSCTLLEQPYASIKRLPLERHGFFSPENAKNLKTFIQALKPRIVVELGVWLGESSFFMADLLDDNARLYAVDTWVDYPDIKDIPYMKNMMPKAYWQFLSNCLHLGLAHKIIPVRMTSAQAAQALNISPNLVYIDASHAEEDVFNDIVDWYPKIIQGGICCGDDWNWESVRKGVIRASKELRINIHQDGTFWYFDPKQEKI